MENTLSLKNNDINLLDQLFSNLYEYLDFIYTIYPLLKIEFIEGVTNRSMNSSIFYTDGYIIYINKKKLLLELEKNNHNIIYEFSHTLFHFLLHHAIYNINYCDEEQKSIISDIYVEYILYKYKINNSSSEFNRQKIEYLNKINELFLLKNRKTISKDNQLYIDYNFIYEYIKNIKKQELEYISSIFKVDEHCYWKTDLSNSNSNHNSNNRIYNNNLMNLLEDSEIKNKEDLCKNLNTISELFSNYLLFNQKKCNNSENCNEMSVYNDTKNKYYENNEKNINNELIDSILYEKINIKKNNKKSYRDLLNHFIIKKEICKIDLDSFDNNYYTLGMQLYDNMPLIDPIETRYTKSLDTFFIAIDTSGSVRGDKVREFIYNICSMLFEIHKNIIFNQICIIQCDCKVQKINFIKSKNDLINLINNFFIFGYGTTSYLPVFNFINNFKIKNCHSRIRGLIYYTDGLGTIFDSKKEFTYLYCNENNRILKLIPKFSIEKTLA